MALTEADRRRLMIFRDTLKSEEERLELNKRMVGITELFIADIRARIAELEAKRKGNGNG